ncbi:hypothetical protein FDJ58_gp135 [Bacillus phage SIOphi]|uniref:Uncharacterized protein n=1 Tax=Bacillus phage SIOphi TaxID=1285382 RepID=R4JF28_9CAUD|nr:hypothetical protein FDJ58_gp135 [Bacillus phage SIOphi]AGK86943.1 hypothetical protein SIOphi_00675 [Bacillus phage SIOphi]
MIGKYIFIASKEEGKIFTDSRNTIRILDSANEFEKLKEEYLDKKNYAEVILLGSEEWAVNTPFGVTSWKKAEEN